MTETHYFIEGISVEMISKCIQNCSDHELRQMFFRRRRRQKYWTPKFPINQIALRAYLIYCSADRHWEEFEEAGDTAEGANLETIYLHRYKSRPTLDIIETCGALHAGLFTEEDIEEIYFKIINRPFQRGEYNWSIHVHERPIHIFTKEGLANIICNTIDDVGNKSEHPAFTFYANLKDRVAFEHLTKCLLEQGVCKTALAGILDKGEVFSSWQCNKIAEVCRAFAKSR